jgi:hypothetical protein
MHERILAGSKKCKMISREKDSGFGWKLEDFEFRAALTVRKNRPRLGHLICHVRTTILKKLKIAVVDKSLK